MSAVCEAIAQSLRVAFDKRPQARNIIHIQIALAQANEPQPIPQNTIQALTTMMDKQATNSADIAQLFMV